MGSLFLYRTSEERRTPAVVHYSIKNAPNKRPTCKLGAQPWPLNQSTWIVSTDKEAVTCKSCRRGVWFAEPTDA